MDGSQRAIVAEKLWPEPTPPVFHRSKDRRPVSGWSSRSISRLPRCLASTYRCIFSQRADEVIDTDEPGHGDRHASRHSITSSARTRRADGTDSPSGRATC